MPLDPEIEQYLNEMAALGGAPAWEQPLADVRRQIREQTALIQRLAVGSVEDSSVAGGEHEVPVRIYRPPPSERPTGGLVVFFHGGGFVFGDLDTHDAACRNLCVGADAIVVGVDYRLAPEHRFPAAFEDTLSVARWALANAAALGADARKVVLMGDSAGGNLAAVTANATKNESPPPAGQILVYPVTDLRDVPGYASRSEAGTGYGLTREAMEWFCDCYAPEVRQREDPRASPVLERDLAGAPPALVLTVEFDPLTSEAEAYAERLAAAGVRVDLIRVPGAIHGALTNGAGWTAGERLWDALIAWLAERFTAVAER